MDSYSEVLAQCLDDIERGRETIEDCVARFPQFAELDNMLRAVAAARELPRPAMPVADRDAIRQQALMRLRASTAARATANRRRVPVFSAWQRFVLIGSVILIFILAGGIGLVKASELALPNDALYVIKRIDEQIELSFASDSGRVATLKRIAEARLSEVEALVARDLPLSDAIIADTSSSVLTALMLQTDVAQQSSLYDYTVRVFTRAQAKGAISQNTTTRVLAIVTIQPLDKPGSQQPASTPTPVTQTIISTPTGTLTAPGSPAESVTATPGITAPDEVTEESSATQPKGAGPTRRPTQKNPPGNENSGSSATESSNSGVSK